MRLLKSIACQLLAFWITRLAAGHLTMLPTHPFMLVVAQGATATLMSRMLGQAPWWQALHLIVPAIGWALLELALPPWLYLTAFMVLLLLFWGCAWGDVPLFLSSDEMIDMILPIIEHERPQHIAELGAGIGTVVIPLAKRFPDISIHAIERAPLPWLILHWRCRKLANVKILRQDLWQCRLAQYSVVFAFLSPLVMRRLGDKVMREMPRGSLLLSAAFDVPGWTADRMASMNSQSQKGLFCYRIPKSLPPGLEKIDQQG